VNRWSLNAPLHPDPEPSEEPKRERKEPTPADDDWREHIIKGMDVH